jgi:DNA-directed RNA polymerase specialized sigma subunit
MGRPSERRRRFVHLGERLASIERIRAGSITRAEAAAELGVDEAEVLRWIELHQGERVVTIDELRDSSESPGDRLAARARRLATLLAAAERRVRELHLELISKEFGEKPHRDFEPVARAQPRGD